MVMIRQMIQPIQAAGEGGDDPTDPGDDSNNPCTCGAYCICKCTCGKWMGKSCAGFCSHSPNAPPGAANDPDVMYCECHHVGGDDDEDEDEEENPGSAVNPGALQAGNGTLGSLPSPNERPAKVQIPQRLKDRFSKLRTDFVSKTGLNAFKNMFQYRAGKMDKLCVSNPIREFNGVELPEMKACLDLDELAQQSWVPLLRNVLLFMVVCMFVGAVVVVLRQY